jgi:hypothetical protein
MDLKDYTKPDPNNLNDLLMYCASLRNVYSLPHRTLNEFNWFVHACIFKKEEDWEGILELYPQENLKEKYIKKFREIYSPCKPDLLIKYAGLFVEYCEDIYVKYNDDDGL